MAGFSVPLTAVARSAVSLATALAMLLPLPVRCAACAANVGDCPQCATAKAENSTGSTKAACCQKQAESQDEGLAGDVVRPASHHLPRCGCHARPVPRTVPPGERLVPVQDLVAALPIAADLTFHIPSHAVAGVSALGELPPPVPHRILHCSWLI